MVDEGARSLGFAQVSIPEGYDRFMLRQLFEPWAAELVARAEIGRGHRVLDVASGLGPVARLAAEAAGPGGCVAASDISAAMLALAAARPADPGWAPIEYLECPASAITARDDSFDAVLCQHGLQFFPDRAAAAREMRRVARPGGIVVLSTWAAEHPLGLFGPVNETLREAGLAEPFPRASVRTLGRSAGILRLPGALHPSAVDSIRHRGQEAPHGRLCELSGIWSGNRSRLALEMHDVTPRTY
jgi:SAM-dependent methyltransferase